MEGGARPLIRLAARATFSPGGEKGYGPPMPQFVTDLTNTIFALWRQFHWLPEWAVISIITVVFVFIGWAANQVVFALLKLAVRNRDEFWKGMLKADQETPGAWRDAMRAYQACAGFADAQVGRLLDALDASGRADSTVIVLWSDHGYHLGEKTHWEKFALWEKTTHVPFLIVAPGVAKAGGVCHRPVDLMSVYPTLIELCGLTPKPELDGVSLVPLLRAPDAPWERPAVMTYQRGNHAVRSERWRYIRYADGSEELYDHSNDPNEWTNLADDPGRQDIKARLRKWLPKQSAKPAPDLKRPKR